MNECAGSFFIRDSDIFNCRKFRKKFTDSGLSLYEVIRIIDQKVLFEEDHLRRLERSLELTGHSLWVPRSQIISDTRQLINLHDGREGNIKIIANFSDSGEQHYLIYYISHYYPGSDEYLKGVKVISHPFERQEPNKKIWRPLLRRNVSNKLKKYGAHEVLLLDKEGFVPEGSRSNLFIISGDQIITPPEEMILPGITRDYALKICKESGFPVKINKLSLDKIQHCDAAFLTSTSNKILPLCEVDGVKLEVNHPWMKRIIENFDQMIPHHLS